VGAPATSTWPAVEGAPATSTWPTVEGAPADSVADAAGFAAACTVPGRPTTATMTPTSNMTRRTDRGTRSSRGAGDKRGIPGRRGTGECVSGTGRTPEVGVGADFARVRRRGLGIPGFFAQGAGSSAWGRSAGGSCAGPALGDDGS